MLLFFIGLLLRLPFFLNPVAPAVAAEDGFLYQELLSFITQPARYFPILYPLLAYLFIFFQAIILNGLMNEQKLFPTPNYLTAFAYMLITALVPAWNTLSAGLIVNAVLVWAWPRMVSLQHHASPKTVLFNIGFGFGLCSFIYVQSLYLLLLLIAALIIFRPFYLTEWLVAVVGILTPIYFLLVYLFLSDRWGEVHQLVPPPSFQWPHIAGNINFWVTLALIALPLVIGSILNGRNVIRMIVQIRKSWSFMRFYLIIALLIPLINLDDGHHAWLLALVPVSAYHAAFYYYPRRKVWVEWFCWLSIGWLVVNYTFLAR